MERFQHVEAVLLLSFCALYAGASMLGPRASPRAATFASLASDGISVAPMITIVVTGKRLTAAQKHSTIAAEVQAAITPAPAGANAG